MIAVVNPQGAKGPRPLKTEIVSAEIHASKNENIVNFDLPTFGRTRTCIRVKTFSFWGLFSDFPSMDSAARPRWGQNPVISM